jgi:(carboxyethyl)arginine beta-lactam-synthase
MIAPTSSAEAALPRQGRQQALPPVCGFALALGTGPTRGHPQSAHNNPWVAQLGEHTRLEETAGGVPWAGTLIGRGTLARDGNTALVLAGELYNRDDLARAAGGDAGGVPDADLVLALWRRYDLAALRLLNGRYALILADAGRVVAATDHAGSIPLHLSVRPEGQDGQDGTVHAATEAKTLYAQGLKPHQVAAGTAVVLHHGTRRTVRTWVPPQSRRIVPADEAVADLRCRLSRAVRARCAGDRRPTVVLSGGIDSSAVTALTAAACGGARTVSLGTDAGDEFAAAALVARHVGTEHEELTVGSEQLVAELAWAVWAAEITDPDVLEYLLPLVALYRRLPGRRRILTGYGADIPLGGMHRDTAGLGTLDEVLATDMATYDGLNEMCPALSGIAGHWTTHPYWDRDVLDLLVGLEPGLKRRDGTDKWVLRTAFRDLLPDSVVRRRKLGIHEGSGTTSTWTRLLLQDGVPPQRIPGAKLAQARRLHQRLVAGGEHPADLAGGPR